MIHWIHKPMGAMLVNAITTERLPITDMVFDRGGAITEIWTLEDGKNVAHDSSLLSHPYVIEFIDCRRACDVQAEMETLEAAEFAAEGIEE